MFDGRWRQKVEHGVAPLGSALGIQRLTPDHLTVLGLLMAVADAVVIATGHLFIGLVLLILSAVPDLLDGAIAKATGLASVRGAFFDSVSDRVTDSLILGGIAWHLASSGGRHDALLPFAVLATSTLISYERAKAESLGFTAKGGLMERAERVIALCIALAFPALMLGVLWLMLALTSWTAVQRFVRVWRQAPGPVATPTEAVAAAREAREARQASAGRWREWREASMLRAGRTGLEPGRWRVRRRGGPHAGRVTRERTSAAHGWRRRDRTRP